MARSEATPRRKSPEGAKQSRQHHCHCEERSDEAIFLHGSVFRDGDEIASLRSQ